MSIVSWQGSIIVLAFFAGGFFLGQLNKGSPSNHAMILGRGEDSLDSTTPRSEQPSTAIDSKTLDTPNRPSSANDYKLNQRSLDDIIASQINTLRWIQQADAASLKEWLIEATVNSNHDYLTERVALHRLTDLDPSGALALADHPDFSVQGLLSGVMARLAATNLPLAFSALDALPKRHKASAARGILDGHPTDDPEAWIALSDQTSS